MLSVPNRTTWENFFKELIIKDCDVHIYDYSNNLLLDKTHITNFSITNRNSFVAEEPPSIEGTIKIVDYKGLSTSIKTYLESKTTIGIKFVVNNIETTDKILVNVTSIRVSHNQYEAEIGFELPITNWYSEVVRVFTDGVETRKEFLALPPDITYGDFMQYANLQAMKGVKYNGVDFSGIVYKNYAPTVPDGNFDIKNVYRDYEIEIEEEDKSNITIYGIEQKTPQQIFDISETYQQSMPRPAINIPTYDLRDVAPQGLVVTSYTFIIHESDITATNSYFYQENYYLQAVVRNQQYSTTARLIVNGYTVNLVTPTGNDNDKYIQTMAVVHGSAEATQLQTYCRNYFSKNKIVSFNCRIDPTIEPLDIIQMELNEALSNIAVEEVTINFNGGFTGSIKGRIVWELTSLIAPTVQFNINNQNFVDSVNDSYNFVVTNNNPVAVDIVFVDEDTYIIKKVSIPANSTVTLYSTTDLNNDLDEYVRARNVSVVGYFEYDEVQSSSVVALETRDIIPPTVTSSVYGNTFDITVKNDNLYEVYLNIDYSGGTLQEVIPPYSTRQFNQDDLPELDTSAEAYDSGELAYAVTCYFENSDYGFTSTTVMIWEANV